MLDSWAVPKVVSVVIKASKTDPFRKGVVIYLGRTNTSLCPVAAVTAYLAVRGNKPGPFFLLASGKPLSREVLVCRVRAAVRPSGIDTSGHSFRIGQLLLLLQLAWRIPSFVHLGGGKVQHICSM